MLRQINELVDFSFILEELQSKYCLDNGRNAIPPIRMFKYLLYDFKTAKSAGLFGMEIQGATTIFVVNLKRILKLLNKEE